MSRVRVASFFALIVLGCIVSSAIGQMAFPLNQSLCVAWSGDAGVCVVSNSVEAFVSSNAHVVLVLLSGFVCFLVACRAGRVYGAVVPALGILLYSAVSWSLALHFEFSGVTPQEALAVVFSGSCALVFFHLRSLPTSPNKTMEPTR